MSPLYLTCGLCSRKQADGLLSRSLWGHLEGTPHGTLQACPRCMEEYGDWQQRLVAGANGGTAAAHEGPRSIG
jgi:hypothetical protein